MGEQMFTMKSEVVSHIVIDDLVQTADQRICERQHLTISKLSCKFPQMR
jgi:hypothetical protein